MAQAADSVRDAVSALFRTAGDKLSELVFGDIEYSLVVNAPSSEETTRLLDEMARLKREIATWRSSGLLVQPPPGAMTERVIERVVSGVTNAELATLENSLKSEIYRVAANATSQNSATYAAVALTNRIDALHSVAISGATITGSTLSGSVTGDVVGNLTGDVTGAGTSTFSGIRLSSLDCSANASGGKLTTDASGDVICGDDGGATVSVSDFAFFNGSGTRQSTTTNQLLLGASATTSLAKLEVVGDQYLSGSLGVGTTSPGTTLAVAGAGLFNSTLTAYGGVTAPYFTATSTVGTSTFAGFINVLGVNSTSTFSGNLAVNNSLVNGNLSISGVTNALLKTSSSGLVLAAVAGTDYLTAAVTAVGPAGQTADGPTVTFATSSSPYQGLTASTTITGSVDTLTFTNTLSGILAAGGGGTGISNPAAAGVLLGTYAGGAWQQLATSSLGIAISDTTGNVGVARGGTGATSFSYGLVFSSGGANALSNIATSSLGLLTTHVAEGSNLYYTDVRAESFVHGSSTIPKTYTANTFTNTNVFSLLTTLSGGASSTNLSLLDNLYAGRSATTTVRGDGATSTFSGPLSNTSGNFIIGANGTSNSLLLNPYGGNVGIGTTNPGSRLEVVGDIISKGTAWTARTSAADNQWQSVTYGNGLFVAVADTGTGNRVMTSPDGVTWTARTSAADNSWYSVTYGNGLFVAVAYTGTGNRVMTSPDGVTWTARTSAADNSWLSVTYGNGLFVAVANTGTGNRVMTSPDGITWTIRTSAADNSWYSVTYGNGLFVAVAETGTGNRVMTSPDGVTWTARTSAADNSWHSVTYGNGLFVAVAYTGTGNRVMTSPDGVTWTTRTSAADNNWFSVTYGNGLFVAVAFSGTGNRVMTSPDGVTWTIRTSAADNSWLSVTYGNGLFVAVGISSNGDRVMTSGKTETIPFSANNLYQGGMNIFGNVGIGTTSPWAQLSVNPNGITGPAFVIGSSTKTDFVVTNGGYVGIGTSNPGGALHVKGGGVINSLFVDAGNGRVGIATSTNLSMGLFAIENSSAVNSLFVADAPNDATPFVVDNLGRVGIASSTPRAYLSLTVPAGSAFPAVMIDQTLAADIFTLLDSGSTVFTVKDGGNVGIGTTTPWRTLSVTGTAGFDGLTGATGAGSICLSANKELVYNSGSDACLPSLASTKHDIAALAFDGVALVRQLRPVSFVYNEGDSHTRYGFVAEEASSIDAHLGTYDATGGLSGIDDRALLAALVKAVQELDEDVHAAATASSTASTSAWAVDMNGGLTTVSGNLDLTGHTLLDVSRISGYQGKWSIDEEGRLTVKEVHADLVDTKRLRAETGITTRDATTGLDYCISITAGAVTSTPGECGALVEITAPADALVPETTAATTSEAAAPGETDEVTSSSDATLIDNEASTTPASAPAPDDTDEAIVPSDATTTDTEATTTAGSL